jgi:hypothetical protein
VTCTTVPNNTSPTTTYRYQCNSSATTLVPPLHTGTSDQCNSSATTLESHHYIPVQEQIQHTAPSTNYHQLVQSSTRVPSTPTTGTITIPSTNYHQQVLVLVVFKEQIQHTAPSTNYHQLEQISTIYTNYRYQPSHHQEENNYIDTNNN